MSEQVVYLEETTRMATEYYVSGRVAVASGMHSICGNLFHHAFELIIKAALMKKVEVNSVRPPYRHDIPRLWNDFKKHYSISETKYDICAMVLHMFEDLRYPDQFINDHNQVSIFGMGISATSVKFGTSPGVGVVLDVDELKSWWLYIHKETGFNPEYSLQFIRSPANSLISDHLINDRTHR